MPALNYAKIAALYDLYAQTEVDVPFFLQQAQGCRSVLELTCGTGRLSLPLLKAQVPLSCLDNSSEMLAVLRQKLVEQSLTAPVYEMDAATFTIPQQFDLVIIPFNAFAEFIETNLQRSVVERIYAHLIDQGRFICTLHNPVVRLKTIDGQLHLRGKFALPSSQGTLFLSSWENYDRNTHLVTGAQFYEIFDEAGNLQSKRFVDLKFHLQTRESFQSLIETQGFVVEALFGDYNKSAYDPEISPFMIWILSKG